MPEKLRVTAIQRLCVNDGPGVRTVVFLKGCSLKCPWCCNPENIYHSYDLCYNRGGCLYPQYDRICLDCELYGGSREKERCPLGVYERTYNDYGVDELLQLILRDKNLYANGGGVTFSGGEPLVHSSLLKPVLKELKKYNVHIAYESTLFSTCVDYNMVCSFVDYWIVDLKFQYGYVLNADYKISSSDFYENLRDLQSRGTEVKYRMVVMDDILGKAANIANKLLSHNICQIELLPCHSLSEIKYKQLGKKNNQFGMPSYEQMQQINKVFKNSGVEATFLSF